MTKATIAAREVSREGIGGTIVVERKYDLIVVGGGFAGTCAALEAAEKGLHTLLIDKNNCLGGAASNCLVIPFMNYWTKDPETGENQFLAGSLFMEITRRMKLLGGLHDNLKTFDEEVLKLVLMRMCREYGVELLLNASVVEARVEEHAIRAVKVWGKSCMLELSADYFVDATGDAELSVLSGCRYRVGREEDNLCQPMTLCFRVHGVDREKFLANKPSINPLYQQFQRDGKIKNPREDVLSFSTLYDDILHFNTTRVVKLDPTDPFAVTRAEQEAREQVYEMHNFLKSNIPGFERSHVLSTALQIGIRESRMVEGEYTLNVDDLKSLARFPDAIAVSNYDIDIHSPDGAGTDHYYFGDGEWYEIPYRCLVPKDCDNLLVAGRCISSTHEAQASYRIMPYCAELGQAAGAAVSVAKKSGVDVRNVDVSRVQRILRDEGFLI